MKIDIDFGAGVLRHYVVESDLEYKLLEGERACLVFSYPNIEERFEIGTLEDMKPKIEPEIDRGRIVRMVEHKDYVFVATEKNVYQMIDGKMEKVPFVEADE